MVSGYVIFALDARLANELAGSAASLQPVVLGHYSFRELLLSVDQMADPIFRRCDAKGSHAKILVASVVALGLDYRNEMKTVR